MTTPESDLDPDFVPVAPGWWVSNLGGIVLCGVVAAVSRRPLLRWVFALAATTHVVEGTVAYRRARTAGLRDLAARRWGLQTLAVGFPSLIGLGRLLRERAERAERAPTDDA